MLWFPPKHSVVVCDASCLMPTIDGKPHVNNHRRPWQCLTFPRPSRSHALLCVLRAAPLPRCRACRWVCVVVVHVVHVRKVTVEGRPNMLAVVFVLAACRGACVSTPAGVRV